MSITLFIILFTSLISISAFRNAELFDKLKLNPYLVVKRKDYIRIISHSFLHVDWAHLIFNMLTLYFFGEFVEQALKLYFSAGSILYILLYLLGGIISTLPTIYKHRNNHWYNSAGASGAVAAVLFAGILFDPRMGIYLFFIPVPIPGYLFGLAYLAYSHYMSRKSKDNINHDAHLAGAVFGFIFPLLLKPALFQIFISNLING